MARAGARAARSAPTPRPAAPPGAAPLRAARRCSRGSARYIGSSSSGARVMSAQQRRARSSNSNSSARSSSPARRRGTISSGSPSASVSSTSGWARAEVGDRDAASASRRRSGRRPCAAARRAGRRSPKLPLGGLETSEDALAVLHQDLPRKRSGGLLRDRARAAWGQSSASRVRDLLGDGRLGVGEGLGCRRRRSLAANDLAEDAQAASTQHKGKLIGDGSETLLALMPRPCQYTLGDGLQIQVKARRSKTCPPRSSSPTTARTTRTTRSPSGGCSLVRAPRFHIAYARHTHEPDSDREKLAQSEARGAARPRRRAARRRERRASRRDRPLDARAASARSPQARARRRRSCSARTRTPPTATSPIGNSAQQPARRRPAWPSRSRRSAWPTSDGQRAVDRRHRRRRRRRPRRPPTRSPARSARRSRRSPTTSAGPAGRRLASRGRAGPRRDQRLGRAPRSRSPRARCSCCRAAAPCRSARGRPSAPSAQRLTKCPRRVGGGLSDAADRRPPAVCAGRRPAPAARVERAADADARRGPVHSHVSRRLRGVAPAAGPHGRHGIVAAVTDALQTTVAELPDSRVRVQRAGRRRRRSSGSLERKAKQLGRELEAAGLSPRQGAGPRW